MNKRFFNQQNLTRRLRLLPVLFAMLLMPFSAWAQTITVAGVSPDAYGNFEGISGVHYEAVVIPDVSTSYTLTLNGATINGQISSDIAALKVHLVGENTITPEGGKEPFVYNNAANTGTLTFESSNSEAGELLMSGISEMGSIGSGYTVTNEFTLYGENGSRWIKEAYSDMINIYYNVYYGITVNGTSVSKYNKNAVMELSGTDVSYTPADNTLHVPDNPAVSDYEIQSHLSALNVSINGNCALKSIRFALNDEFPAQSGTLTIMKDETSANGVNKLTLRDANGVIRGFTSVTIEEPLVLRSPASTDALATASSAVISDYATGYNVIVAGVQVTDVNKGNVLNDAETPTVVFTPADNTVSPATPATLTLNGATINGKVRTNYANLTIELIGKNTIEVNDTSALATWYAGTNLVFTTSETSPGSLTMKPGADFLAIDTYRGFNITYNNGLVYIPSTSEIKVPFAIGDGTANNPYVLSSADDLKLFSELYNASVLASDCYVELGDDIDCTGLQGFEPIGTPEMPFIGHFDGASHKISNLLYDAGSEDDYAGLFRKVGDDDEPVPGDVLNLTLENCTFRNGNMYNGAIAGLLNKGTIDNCTVTSCSILNETSAPSSGGIVGGQSGGSITNCIVSGSTIAATSTTGGLAGGIVAYIMGSATVSGCQVTGTDEKPTTITCSSNYYDSGINFTGGIVGNCSDFNYDVISISNNKVSGNTTISSIDNEGGDNTCAGAIVGNKGNASFSNNYYYYTVTTSTKNGEAEVVERSGYQQRGTGYSSYDEQLQVVTEDYDIDGAVLYTKLVTLPGETEEGAVTVEGTFYGWDETETGILIAPDQTVTLKAIPGDDSYTISLTATNETTETAITTESEELGDGVMQFTFTMPDAPVTVTLTTLHAYDLWIGETQVTTTNAEDVLGNGKVSFTKSAGQDAAPTYTLTLNGATLTDPVIVGLPNLTFDIQGTNTITTDETCLQKYNDTNTAVTFKSTSAEVGSLTLNSTNSVVSYITDVTVSKELAPIIPNSGADATGGYTSNLYYWSNGVSEAQFVPSYGVQVFDVFVTADNYTDVLGDGKVSFDKGSHTLTLNNASISYSDWGSISTWLPALTIELVGNNVLSSGSYSTLQSLYGVDVAMTLQSSGATKGCLVLKMEYSSENVFLGEHVTLETTDPLAVVSGNLTVNSGNLNVVTIAEPVDYELLVEDIRVVAANASNITNSLNNYDRPKASFDATTNTLTLDNSNFYYTWLGSKVPVQSNIQNLKVKLVGNNTYSPGNSAIFKYTGTVSETSPTVTLVPDRVITVENGIPSVTFGSLTVNGTAGVGDLVIGGYEFADNIGTSEISPDDATSCWTYLDAGSSAKKLSYVEAYDVWYGNNRVISTDLMAGVSGAPYFNPETNTILLNADFNNGPIKSGLDELTIQVDGIVTLNPAYAAPAIQYTGAETGKLTFTCASESTLTSLTLNADNTGAASVSTYKAIEGFASDDITFTSPMRLASPSSDELLTATTVIVNNMKDPGLQYEQGSSAVTEAEWTFGGTDNTLPTLKNTNNLTIEYESSDPTVATIAADGTVTPVGIGQTTITATSSETGIYAGGEASYTLSVYMNLSYSDISIEVDEATYTGSALLPTVTVKNGNTDIADYISVSYTNNTNAALSTAATNAPTVTITPKNLAAVTNYYKGSAQKTFTIAPKELTEDMVTLSAVSFEYNGENQKPNVTVADGTTLTTDDYTLTNEGGIEANTYSVVVTGKNNYTGEVTKTFDIVNRTLAIGTDVQFASGQIWASFYTTTESLKLPEGLMAYIVTAVNSASATLKAINYVPKSVPVLLENNSTMTTTNSSADGNLLLGTTAVAPVSGISGTVYALHNNTLMQVTSGDIPAGRAYLVVNTSSGAPQLSMIINGEGTTAIDALERAEENDTDEWFTLDGRKLQQKPVKSGLYIKNGKKVVIK